MEEAQLASLNEEIYKIYENPMERLAEETHIGIKNVVQRMYLEYGEAFRVKIISTAGFGTRIELEIPEDSGRREGKAYV